MPGGRHSTLLATEELTLIIAYLHSVSTIFINRDSDIENQPMPGGRHSTILATEELTLIITYFHTVKTIFIIRDSDIETQPMPGGRLLHLASHRSANINQRLSSHC